MADKPKPVIVGPSAPPGPVGDVRVDPIPVIEKKPLKIAVYSMGLNEAKFVEKFMASCEGADGVFYTDTGSKDDSIEKFKKLGAHVQTRIVDWSDWPKTTDVEKWKERLSRAWRFDTARNLSLEFVPEDYNVCICLDLDEILHPGWRRELEKSWGEKTTRLRYLYTWNHKADGTADLQYYGDKIHSRLYYEWRHPVHEVLYRTGGDPEKQDWCGLQIEHFPDDKKSRKQYFPMLELAVEEDPGNDRNSHYLGREYFFWGRWKEAKEELTRHLSLPTAQWNAERAASMRYLSKCCLNLNDKQGHNEWAWRACLEAPGEREPWVELSQTLYNQKDYLGGYYAAKNALKIKQRPPSYITQAFAWGALPHDLAGVCTSYLGMIAESRKHTADALKYTPNDQRLIANLKFANRSSAPGVSVVLPKFHLLWPTVRPEKCKEMFRQWLTQATNPQNVVLHVAVNTDRQHSHLDFEDVTVIGLQRLGKVHAVQELAKRLRAEPGDVVIVASDDVCAPEGWDSWINKHLDHFAGGILVNDGCDDGPRVSIPILDYGCFVRFGRIIFHPSYNHHYAEVELYDNLNDLGLVKDLRGDGEHIFKHNTWRNESRPSDNVDVILNELTEQDKQNYEKRSSLKVGERLSL